MLAASLGGRDIEKQSGIVTKLYVVSYFARSAIRSGETQIFGGIPGFDRVTSLGWVRTLILYQWQLDTHVGEVLPKNQALPPWCGVEST